MIRSAIFWALAISSGVAAMGEELKLNHPEGVGYDPAGRLYVADTGNSRILVFSPELKLLQTLGSEGKEPGKFARPSDVVVDAQGRLIVADPGNQRVQILAKDGAPIAVIGGTEGDKDGEFRGPTKVAVDENGHIIVSESGNNRLQVFDRDGKHVFTLANRTGPMPIDLIKPDKEGHKKPRDWERTDPGQFNEPGGVFYDRELKRLFVANGWNCRCEVLDYDSATGTITRRPEETGIVWGWWVTKGIDGDVFPHSRLLGCNTGFGNVLVFDNRGSLTNKTPSSMTLTGGPYGAIRDLMDIAVAPNGDLALADAGNNRIVIFPPDLKLPGSPRATVLTRSGATITWDTPQPISPAVRLRQGGYPERTPGQEHPWDTAKIIDVPARGRPATHHEIAVRGLEPGNRYYYRLSCPSLRSIPGGGYTREFAFATLPPKGKTSFVRLPIKLLLLANVANLEAAHWDTPLPQPMTPEEIALYKKDVAETQRFYWCNSSMRYWLDVDFYVDQTMYRTGPDRKDLDPRFTALPRANADDSLKRLIAEAGRQKEVYPAQVIIEAVRNWNAGEKKWVYQGSGGGTYGVEWPTPGRSHFLGGSDIAWLFCHEYHHQMESQYGNSGLDTEDDRVIFCHFSPQYPGWQWCTAFHHGEHWDGIAWQLRHFKAEQYFRNLYGEIALADDADGDGIPDDAPRLPLDEKRFGPRQRPADHMQEVLASKWVSCINTDIRKKVPGPWGHSDPAHLYPAGPAFGDGGQKYTIYPFKPLIAYGHAKVDGQLTEYGDKPDYWMDHAGIKLQGWARWDEDCLVYAFAIQGAYKRLTLVVDQQADGFYVGGDNVYAEFAPTPNGGPEKANVRMHYCNLGRWPWFDDKHDYIKPEVYPFASSRKGDTDYFEFALPRNEACGLYLKPGHKVGMLFNIALPAGGAIGIFEPWTLFDAVLQE